MILEILILMCVASVNSSYKDIIQISIDNNKSHYSKDKNKNIRIEISKSKNQSHQNIISTDGDKYELYKIGTNGQKKLVQNNRKKSHEEDTWHGGKVLSSIEETNDLWEETHKEHILKELGPKTDHIFLDGILNSYENTRKNPAIFARRENNRIDSIKTNAHHSDAKESDSDENGGKISPENKDQESSNNESEEINKCLLAEESANVAKAPCNYETDNANNMKYQANIGHKESDVQDFLIDYSYSVSVQRKGSHYASGALVGERWVLSSAAEFYNVRETIKLFRMRMGSADCKKGGLLTPIQSITLHPRFAPGYAHFDISVLRTAEPVVTSQDVKPIALSKVSSGKVVTAKFLSTYWPRIVIKGTPLPPSAAERVKYNNMRVSAQRLVPSDRCRRQVVAANVSLDANSLCLKPVRLHHTPCTPDAGAPIVASDGLWGITSGWVPPDCPSVMLPTIFTRVGTASVRTWINQQIHL